MDEKIEALEKKLDELSKHIETLTRYVFNIAQTLKVRQVIDDPDTMILCAKVLDAVKDYTKKE